MWNWDSGSGMWINSDTGDVSISQPSSADDGMGFGSGDITSGAARSTAAAPPLSATMDASFANRIVQVGAQAFQYTPSRNAVGQTVYIPAPVQQQSSSFNMIAILGVIGLVLLMRGGQRGA